MYVHVHSYTLSIPTPYYTYVHTSYIHTSAHTFFKLFVRIEMYVCQKTNCEVYDVYYVQ